jgi:menaquinone-dependent protoporphyrinogen IX oxidase
LKVSIFFSSKYGSKGEYAYWIGVATGLPVFNTKDKKATPSEYDFLVIGCPIIYYKLYNRKWVNTNLESIENKPVIFFTVSGAGAGPKLDDWFANSIPKHLILQTKHIALRGRQIPKELTWYDRLMLIIAGLKNPDPVARKEEMEGFDYMDKSSIKPIIELVEQFQRSKGEFNSKDQLEKRTL